MTRLVGYLEGIAQSGTFSAPWQPLLSSERVRRYGSMALLFFAALALFSAENRFKLGLHVAEVLKIRAIVDGQFQYYHPLLMPETTRLAALLLGVAEPQAVVELGRMLSALIGAVGVAGLFLLLSRRVGEITAAALSVAAATTPLIAVHAHYLKEDIWLFGFGVLAILAFRRLADEQKLSSTCLLGVALGLAVSSKAVGAFLVPVFMLTALLQPIATRRRLLASGALAIVVAAATVALINIRMLLDADRAWAGLSKEIQHGAFGNWDGIVFPPGYHLTHSLWPGVGPVLLALGVIGLLLTLLQWRRAEPTDRLMVIYAVIYYAMIEASPLKGGTDMERYALLLVLPLAYGAGLIVQAGGAWLAGRAALGADKTSWAFQAMIAIALIPTAITGARLVANLEEDTRIVADRILADSERQVLSEPYGTSLGSHIRSLTSLDPQRIGPNLRYLVASSFLYDRFAAGAAIGGSRNTDAVATWARYQILFRLPYCEIRPRFMSYGSSNPTIRIIDLQARRAVGESGSSDDRSHAPACASALPEQ